MSPSTISPAIRHLQPTPKVQKPGFLLPESLYIRTKSNILKPPHTRTRLRHRPPHPLSDKRPRLRHLAPKRLSVLLPRLLERNLITREPYGPPLPPLGIEQRPRRENPNIVHADELHPAPRRHRRPQRGHHATERRRRAVVIHEARRPQYRPRCLRRLAAARSCCSSTSSSSSGDRTQVHLDPVLTREMRHVRLVLPARVVAAPIDAAEHEVRDLVCDDRGVDEREGLRFLVARRTGYRDEEDGCYARVRREDGFGVARRPLDQSDIWEFRLQGCCL